MSVFLQKKAKGRLARDLTEKVTGNSLPLARKTEFLRCVILDSTSRERERDVPMFSFLFASSLAMSLRMGVFVRELHEALYLLFEPRLFSSSFSISDGKGGVRTGLEDERGGGGQREEEQEGRRRRSEEKRKKREVEERSVLRMNGELVFSLLHPQVMQMAVPSLKPRSRLRLLLTFLHCIER